MRIGGQELKPWEARVIRKQWCLRCDSLIAVSLENEHWWRKNGYGPWVQERWFGNHIKCPGCGREGNLPMDKPLSYESGGIMKEVLR